jgi:CRP-like cAMP-binding protein
MSALLSKQDIANYTGLSVSSVERILWRFQQQNTISDVMVE